MGLKTLTEKLRKIKTGGDFILLRRKFFVFLGTLLGPVLGFIVVNAFGDPSAEAAILLWGFMISFSISGSMIPLAFIQLEGLPPRKSGTFFLIMVFPLVVSVSHPIMSALAILLNWWPSYTVPWILGTMLNSLIFFAVGYWYGISKIKLQKPLHRATIGTLVLVIIYVVGQVALSQVLES